MINLTTKENKMKDDVNISIIVPTYNRSNIIQRCLKSLLGQTFKNLK